MDDSSEKVESSLEKMWPRPDWGSHINDERTEAVIEALNKLYDSIRRDPRKNETSISDIQWEEAYATSIEVLKAVFRKTKNLEQAGDINKRFSERFNIQYEDLRHAPIENCYLYWAVSKKLLPANNNDALDVSISSAPLIDASSKQAINERALPSIANKLSAVKKNRTRVGPAIQTKDLSLDQFRADFSFKLVVINPTSKDAGQLIQQAYEAFSDLADAIGLPKKWLGMGTVVLRFGYEDLPNLSEKNESITYTLDGVHDSLAHQWANCIDARIAATCGAGKGEANANASTMQQKELVGAFSEKSKAAYSIVRKITNKMGVFSEYHFSSSNFEVSNEIAAGKVTALNEMFAKAFDAFVEDKFITAARLSPNLTADTKHHDGAPYPMDRERKEINSLFDALLIVLKKTEASSTVKK